MACSPARTGCVQPLRWSVGGIVVGCNDVLGKGCSIARPDTPMGDLAWIVACKNFLRSEGESRSSIGKTHSAAKRPHLFRRGRLERHQLEIRAAQWQSLRNNLHAPAIQFPDVLLSEIHHLESPLAFGFLATEHLETRVILRTPGFD